jgi:hypothetical protein
MLTRNVNKYMGSFYTDQMMDEDYYGLGVCKWTLTIAGVELKERTNTFHAHLAIDANNVISELPNTLYFLNSIYTDLSVQNFIHDGTAKHPEYKQFSVTTSIMTRAQ